MLSHCCQGDCASRLENNGNRHLRAAHLVCGRYGLLCCAYSTATRSNNGDFSRFIEEYKADAGEASAAVADHDADARFLALKVGCVVSYVMVIRCNITIT